MGCNILTHTTKIFEYNYAFSYFQISCIAWIFKKLFMAKSVEQKTLEKMCYCKAGPNLDNFVIDLENTLSFLYSTTQTFFRFLFVF